MQIFLSFCHCYCKLVIKSFCFPACSCLSCLSLQFVCYFLLSYDGQRRRIFIIPMVHSTLKREENFPSPRCYSAPKYEDRGCFSLCQCRSLKCGSYVKLIHFGSFRFLPTEIFGITSGGGPLASVELAGLNCCRAIFDMF